MPTTANINCRIWLIKNILPIDLIEANTHFTTYCFTYSYNNEDKNIEKIFVVTQSEVVSRRDNGKKKPKPY